MYTFVVPAQLIDNLGGIVHRAVVYYHNFGFRMLLHKQADNSFDAFAMVFHPDNNAWIWGMAAKNHTEHAAYRKNHPDRCKYGNKAQSDRHFLNTTL